jgi:hypothetical protein
MSGRGEQQQGCSPPTPGFGYETQSKGTTMIHDHGKQHGNGKSNGTHSNRIAAVLDQVFRPTTDEKLCLRKIEELWRAYQHRGLEARYAIGRALNKLIGDPTDRQARGRGVMALASERLGISVSTLSRMRWFAHSFTSVEDARKQHPKIDSWTKLKDVLPDLMPKGRKKSKSVPASARFTKRVARSVHNLTSTVKKTRTGIDPAGLDDVLEMFRELADAVESKLQIRLKVTTLK